MKSSTINHHTGNIYYLLVFSAIMLYVFIGDLEGNGYLIRLLLMLSIVYYAYKIISRKALTSIFWLVYTYFKYTRIYELPIKKQIAKIQPKFIPQKFKTQENNNVPIVKSVKLEQNQFLNFIIKNRDNIQRKTQKKISQDYNSMNIEQNAPHFVKNNNLLQKRIEQQFEQHHKRYEMCTKNLGFQAEQMKYKIKNMRKTAFKVLEQHLIKQNNNINQLKAIIKQNFHVDIITKNKQINKISVLNKQIVILSEEELINGLEVLSNNGSILWSCKKQTQRLSISQKIRKLWVQRIQLDTYFFCSKKKIKHQERMQKLEKINELWNNLNKPEINYNSAELTQIQTQNEYNTLMLILVINIINNFNPNKNKLAHLHFKKPMQPIYIHVSTELSVYVHFNITYKYSFSTPQQVLYCCAGTNNIWSAMVNYHDLLNKYNKYFCIETHKISFK